jgi:amino acid adenylation domain-containing protein
LQRIPTRPVAARSPELLGDYLAHQAAVRPDDVAVVDGDRRSTYGEVDELGNRLAKLLVDQGLRPGDRVCLVTPKTTGALVAMHAVMRAGGAYVPLDVDSPAPRIRLILGSSRPRILLASRSATELIRELGESNAIATETIVGSLDAEPLEVEAPPCRFTLADAQAYSESSLPPAARPEHPAHLLFTSGSTGVPKGVAITHANAKAFVEWATSYFGITHADRNSSHPPLHFDLSTFDIYGTFAVGAELHLVPVELNQLPTRLASFIEQRELTQWFSVPSLLSYLAKFDVVPSDGFPSLRRVLWAGEVLPTKTLIYWMQRVRQASFTNLYGPTETTISSSYHTVPACPKHETEPIPIGVACEGEELLVLDDELKPVPAGEAGMLFIGGVGLSPGYWEDEEKTRDAFLPDPRDATGSRRIYRTGDLARVDESGIAHFLGRADTQIKSRGYRIELGEIETHLAALSEVSECAVIAFESEGFEGLAIGCAYAPAPGEDVSPTKLKADLGRVLPRYMIPTYWRLFEELPKNVNGKIDRVMLRELFATKA